MSGDAFKALARQRVQRHVIGAPPQPLVREEPSREAYAVEGLGRLRPVVEAVQGKRLAPVAIPAQSALCSAALAVQGLADVETLGGRSPVSLYGLTLAKSGERKSSCDRDMMAGVFEFERTASAKHVSNVTSWKNDQAVWKVQRDACLGGLKGNRTGNADEVRRKLDAIGPEPDCPVRPDRVVTEPTYEGLVRKFEEGSLSLGIFSDEAGQFLGGHAMSKDHRQKTMSGLNDLWHGNPIRRTRKGDGSSVLYNRRLSMHLMVQPGVARNLLANPEASDIGFLARFLICEPESTIGLRTHDRVCFDPAPIDAFKARIMELLSMDMRAGQAGGVETRLLLLSEDARALLIAFSDTIEREQAPGRSLADLSGPASKIAEQAVRIAAVLTLFEDAEATEVSAERMANGIKIAQYHLSEALRLSISAQASEKMSRAETLRQWLIENYPTTPFVTADVYQKGPAAFRDAETAREALELLISHGVLKCLGEGAVVDGKRRKEAWQLIRDTFDVV